MATVSDLFELLKVPCSDITKTMVLSMINQAQQLVAEDTKFYREAKNDIILTDESAYTLTSILDHKPNILKRVEFNEKEIYPISTMLVDDIDI